jgi:hypothetical protein
VSWQLKEVGSPEPNTSIKALGSKVLNASLGQVTELTIY